MFLLLFADFSKLTFPKNTCNFNNTIRVSNSLAPDQDRHFVGPDLGLNCLQRLSAADNIGDLRVMAISVIFKIIGVMVTLHDSDHQQTTKLITSKES